MGEYTRVTYEHVWNGAIRLNADLPYELNITHAKNVREMGNFISENCGYAELVMMTTLSTTSYGREYILRFEHLADALQTKLILQF